MKTIDLSVPGKVFLGGEYLALNGGATLLAGIEPRFRLQAKENLKKNSNPFHPQSPAGQLWVLNQEKLEIYEIQFQDPHQGRGGFGGSTAEFILLYSLLKLQDATSMDAQSELDLQEMLKEYRRLSATAGHTPSGADLIAQFRGGLTYFSREHGKIQNYGWLYPNLGFIAAKTNFKLKTYEHLSTLQDFSSEKLAEAMKLVSQALESTDGEKLVMGLEQFADELSTLGFVCENTQKILGNLQHDGILVKKGCGAMGADVVLVIYDQQKTRQIQTAKFADKFGFASHRNRRRFFGWSASASFRNRTNDEFTPS